jgi:predicted NBD/HSP70 family sugar kinase
VRIAFADDEGRIGVVERTATGTLGTPERFVAWIAGQTRRHGTDVSSLAIGAPGLIDAERRTLLDAPNLDGWRDVPLPAMVEDALGCRTYMENDANLAAVAEFRHGAGRGYRNLVYATWSTGIGCGLILDGRLYTGSHGLAGEMGHMIAAPDGPQCACGQRGCLEALCGGASLARGTGVSARRLFAAAAAGDQSAQAVVGRACTAMGDALVTLTNLLDPDAIVIGGGFSNSWPLVSPRLARVLESSPFIKPGRRPALHRATLGSDAGHVGATEWARIKWREALAETS